jgi:iron complex outermembrane recepter protein
MNKCGNPNLTPRLIMRVTLLQLLLAGGLVISASARNVHGQGILDRRISLSETGQNLKRVLRNIEQAADVKFTYDSRLVAAQGEVNVDARNEILKNVLDRLLLPLSIRYEVVNDQIILKKGDAFDPTSKIAATEAVEDQTMVTGTVLSSKDGTPIPGASVTVQGTKRGVTTDAKGRFEIRAESGDVLVISAVGFGTFTENVRSSSDAFTVTLQEHNNQLSEVVVTALGVKKSKRSVGYQLQTISGDEVAESNAPNVIDALSGKLAGVVVSEPNGDGLGTSRIVLRGNNNITGDNQPLIVVDGVPMYNNSNVPSPTTQAYTNANTVGSGNDWGSPINDINAYDIGDISVLSGPSAAALYGQRGANGAIIITTKRGSHKPGLGVEYNFSYQVAQPYLYEKLQNEFGVGPGGAQNIFSGGQADYNYGMASYGMLPFPVIGGVQTLPYMSYDPSESWGPKMDGTPVEWWDGKMHPFSPQPNIQKDLFRDGLSATHNVAFSGGGENGTFRVSLTRNDYLSIVPNSGRFQNTANIGGSLKISKRLTADIGLSYMDDSRKNAPNLGDEGADPNSLAKDLIYYFPRGYNLGLEKNYQNPDGTLNYNSFPNANNFAATLGYFPYNANSGAGSLYWNLHNNNTWQYSKRILGSLSLNYAITDFLDLSGRIGLDNQNLDYETTNKPWDEAGILNGYYGRSLARNTTYDDMATLAFHKDNVVKDFNIKIAAGGESYSVDDYQMGASTGTWALPNNYSLANNVGTPPTTTEAYNAREVHSVFGYVDFNYKSLLYIEVTGRNDWSSALPINNDSYFYPSISGSFIFSDLLKRKPDWFTSGKLRASYAKAANDANQYAVYPSYNIGTFNGYPTGSLPSTVPPLGLKPQLANSDEFGTDLGFFQDRVNLDVNYYATRSFDQIFTAPVASSSGGQSVLINSGQINNHGFEVTLKATPIRSRDFRWDIGFNVNRNTSVVESIAPGISFYEMGNIWGGNGPVIAAHKGDAYGTIYGWDYVLDPATKKPIVDPTGEYYATTGGTQEGAGAAVKFVDSAGHHYASGSANAINSETVPVGNATPKFTGGISNVFTYKGFTLSIYLDVKDGGQMYWGDWGTAMGEGLSPQTLYEREGHGLPLSGTDPTGHAYSYNIGVILPGVVANPSGSDYVANTNVVSPVYKYAEYSNWGAGLLTTKTVTDDSWVNVREVSLTYQFPKSFIHDIKFLQDLKISLIGRNLFYLYNSAPDHINPVSNSASNAQGIEFGTMPGVRNYGVSLHTSF